MRITSLVALAALIGVAQPVTAEAKDKVFALVPKAMNNPFFDQARDGCMKAAKEIGGVQCLFIGPADATEQEQVQVVQDLITKHVDGIGVSAANAPAIAKVLARAKEAKIPVVTWDSDLLPADKGLRASYIGTVNEQVGIAVAKQAMALKPNGGTYCIQTGGPAAANMNDRIKGMTETLPADKWKQVAGCPLYNNDDFPLSITQLTDLLAKYPKIDAVLDAGGAPEMEVKAYRELMDKYKDQLDKKDLVMLFVETLPMQMDDLKAGLSDGQVGQRPFEMGYKAIYLLNDLTQGKSVPDPVTIGLDVCTPATIATCKKQLAAQGRRRRPAPRLNSRAGDRPHGQAARHVRRPRSAGRRTRRSLAAKTPPRCADSHRRPGAPRRANPSVAARVRTRRAKPHEARPNRARR